MSCKCKKDSKVKICASCVSMKALQFLQGLMSLCKRKFSFKKYFTVNCASSGAPNLVDVQKQSSRASVSLAITMTEMDT